MVENLAVGRRGKEAIEVEVEGYGVVLWGEKVRLCVSSVIVEGGRKRWKCVCVGKEAV